MDCLEGVIERRRAVRGLASAGRHRTHPDLSGITVGERLQRALQQDAAPRGAQRRVFATTSETQVVTDTWLRQYNHVRPHHALGMRAPVPETILEKPQISGPDRGG